MIKGNLGWVVAVNVVIWTGLFLYLLYLNKKLRDTENTHG
jgi:CcmD family protein